MKDARRKYNGNPEQFKMITIDCNNGLRECSFETYDISSKFSPLGIPDSITQIKDHDERLQRYRRWLFEGFQNNDLKIVAAIHQCKAKLKQEGKLRLVCNCGNGKGCHGYIVQKCIQWVIDQGL